LKGGGKGRGKGQDEVEGIVIVGVICWIVNDIFRQRIYVIGNIASNTRGVGYL